MSCSQNTGGAVQIKKLEVVPHWWLSLLVLLDLCVKLFQKGVHPTIISKSFQKDLEKGIEWQRNCSGIQPFHWTPSSCSSLLYPVSGDGVREVTDPTRAVGVDLKDHRVLQKPQGHYAKWRKSDGERQILRCLSWVESKKAFRVGLFWKVNQGPEISLTFLPIPPLSKD